MNPERWRAIRALFDDVVDLEPDDRARRLRDLATTDPVLHAAVASLLDADEDADQRLKRLDFEIIDSRDTAPATASGSDPFGLVGRTVSRFRIEERIGSGGMGVLYRAHDPQLNRDVALKFPLPWYLLDESARQRFLREGRAAGAVDHPNLCSVYEVGESADGQLFLAMALYHGETLKARLERDGAFDIGEAVQLVRQVARGIGAAHAAGIVHRDLKPANLMLLPDGTIKVLDFGLAKLAEPSLTRSHAQLGTVAYMAPEQIRGGSIDARTDLWALGVVLYELVTGQRPFSGEHDISVAHAIVHDEPVLPSTLRRDVPPALEDLILGLLRKAAERRIASAAELEVALAAVPLDRASSAARPIVALGRKLRHGLARANRRVVAVIALVVVVGVVASTRTFSVSNDARPLSTNAQAQLFYDRGLEYEQRVESPENVDAATSLYERALGLDPAFAHAHARLALSHMRRYAAGYDRSGARLAQVRAEAEAALRLQPDLAEAHLAIGHYWDEGLQNDERALQSYERALRGLPNSAELHAALARLYRGQARWDDAIHAYRRALTLDPSMMNVATDLVFTYSRLRRYDNAIALIDSVIALEPDNHSAKLSKGYMVIRRDGTPDTLAAALARIPADWDPQGMGAFARVTVARLQRRYEQALTILNGASEWMGKGPVLHSRTLLRAQVYEQLGDAVRARADYQAIVTVLEDSAAAYPSDPRWHLALGLTYAGLGQPLTAGREARRAMDLVPLSKDALQGALMMVGAAEIFARAGDADRALELLDRLLGMPAGPEATVPLLRLESNWDALRADPRFEQLLRRHERTTTTLPGS